MEPIRSGLAAVAVLLAASTAFAQDAKPAEPEDEPIPGWFRLDSDGLGLQLWAGATHSLGPVDLATDIYVTSGTFGEFDVGPAIVAGPLTVTPMVGVGFDWGQKRTVSFIPQLYTILDVGPLYFESWIQTFLNSPLVAEANDDFYTRDFILVKLGSVIAVGPQVEATLALNHDRDTLASLPVGGHVNLNYGPADRLELFLGYETQRQARQVATASLDPATGDPRTRDRGLVGRFTYVHTW
jgi:hypothetical protein